jgi:hypothetical protein
MVSVFISHSSKDQALVEQLIRLLRSALQLRAEEIRATSVDGFRLPGGSSTDERLRMEVNDAKVLIGVISQSSIKSIYVVFELGARWGSGKPMVPLLASDSDPELLSGPLAGINALDSRSAAQIHQLLKEVSNHLGAPLDEAAAYQGCIDEIVALGKRSPPSPAEESTGQAGRSSAAPVLGPLGFIALYVVVAIAAFLFGQRSFKNEPSARTEPIEESSQTALTSPVTLQGFMRYLSKETHTDLQRDEFLKRHLGRRVTWDGWVGAVADRGNRGISVLLLAKEGGSSSDAAFLSFPQEDGPELTSLHIGQKITSSCKLDNFVDQALLTACELARVWPADFNISAKFPPFPEGFDTIRPGMKLSEAKAVLPLGNLRYNIYSLDLKKWPFARATYFLEDGKEDPKIEFIMFAFIDDKTSRAVTAVALREFGAVTRSELMGQKLAWSKLKGFDVTIDQDGYTIKPAE